MNKIDDSATQAFLSYDETKAQLTQELQELRGIECGETWCRYVASEDPEEFDPILKWETCTREPGHPQGHEVHPVSTTHARIKRQVEQARAREDEAFAEVSRILDSSFPPVEALLLKLEIKHG